MWHPNGYSSWLPFDEVAFTEDMLFSAAWAVQHRGSLREQRQHFGSILAEMTRRLQPLQSQLKQSAVPHQHKLLDINVSMVITIMYLIKWQDNMLPTRLLQGHNLVSTIAATGVFEACQEEEPPMTREELLSEGHRQSLIEDFRQAKMDKHADFLFQSCLEEEAKGWATPMLQQQEIDAMFPDGWCPTPAFSIEQASGKLRRIDDAKRGMSNRTARYEEKVQLHTALQPAVYCKLALALAKDAGHFKTVEEQQAEVFEHGGEDLPDAYRGLVVAEKDLCCNIVMVKHPLDGTIKFQVVYALLFGFRASVMHYLTWAEFQQAYARRLLVLMWSVYVDDSNIVDFKTARGSGQFLGRRGFQLLGTPFAPNKSKTMNTSNDHLGVVTDLANAISKCSVEFWPRQSVCDKAKGMIQTF